jgi:predicted transcriptional regulator
MIVRDERLKRAIVLALADTELQKIMYAALYQPKSVYQIIQESNVSHSTAYRKLRWLVKEKLLIVDKIEITENGRKASLFRTTLKSFNIKYEHNNLLIEAEQNFDTLRQITENFFILPDPGSPHVSI